MSKTAMSFISAFIYGLTLAVIICSVIVFVTFERDEFLGYLDIQLGYLPILIAVYCSTATLSRAYNMYLNNKESK